MKRTESKKLIYKVPVTHIKDGAVNTNVLAGSEHANGLVKQQDGDYKQKGENSIVVDNSEDVLAKPMHNLWGEE